LTTQVRGNAASSEMRRAIRERLWARQAEIEEATLHRVDAVTEPVGSDDPTYMVGLRAAISAAIEYALADPTHEHEWPPEPPAAVLEQVRRAAEVGVGLEIVLCRIVAGYGSLVEFIMEESYREADPGDHDVPRDMRKTQEALFARLTDAAAKEHRMALSLAFDSPERRRAKVVRALLERKSTDRHSLGYKLDGMWHLAIIAIGPAARDALEKLHMRVGCELVCVPGHTGGHWAWLGSTSRERLAETARLSSDIPAGVAAAIGEPREGLAGWRQTHEEAKAALPLALASPRGITRCADVLLEAALLKNRQLMRLLREVYLAPLDDLMRDNAGVIHETLRAYFASGHNIKVTATRLEVDRRTVWYRLDKVAKRLGGPPEIHRAELEVALRLAALDDACGDLFGALEGG
jgi:sugar diacid utilization regulator